MRCDLNRLRRSGSIYRRDAFPGTWMARADYLARVKRATGREARRHFSHSSKQDGPTKVVGTARTKAPRSQSEHGAPARAHRLRACPGEPTADSSMFLRMAAQDKAFAHKTAQSGRKAQQHFFHSKQNGPTKPVGPCKGEDPPFAGASGAHKRASHRQRRTRQPQRRSAVPSARKFAAWKR